MGGSGGSGPVPCAVPSERGRQPDQSPARAQGETVRVATRSPARDRGETDRAPTRSPAPVQRPTGGLGAGGVRRRAAPAAAPVAGLRPSAGAAALAGAVRRIREGGSGQPLPATVRRVLEHRTGADLSAVRVHRGADATRTAAALSARAYTVGDDIVLGGAVPALADGAARHTLTHEVVHVLQQRRGPVPAVDMGGGLHVSDPADPLERQAARLADGRPGDPVVVPHPASTGHALPAGPEDDLAERSGVVTVQRQGEDDTLPPIDRDTQLDPSMFLRQQDAQAIPELDGPQVLLPGDVYKTGGRTYVVFADAVRTGGVWAWVNRNPGNITCSTTAESFGAFAKKCNGGFAIFPTEQVGFDAIVSYLRTFPAKTILQIMYMYAPKDDGKNPMLKGNDPDGYAAAIVRRLNTGLAPADPARVTTATKVGVLSDDQLQSFAGAIRDMEGGPANPGTEIPYGDPRMPNEIAVRLERAKLRNPAPSGQGNPPTPSGQGATPAPGTQGGSATP